METAIFSDVRLGDIENRVLAHSNYTDADLDLENW
jgi:hypothetical protein